MRTTLVLSLLLYIVSIFLANSEKYPSRSSNREGGNRQSYYQGERKESEKGKGEGARENKRGRRGRRGRGDVRGWHPSSLHPHILNPIQDGKKREGGEQERSTLTSNISAKGPIT